MRCYGYRRVYDPYINEYVYLPQEVSGCLDNNLSSPLLYHISDESSNDYHGGN